MTGRSRLLFGEAWRSLGANLSTTVAATLTVLIGMFLLGLFIALGTGAISWPNHVKKELGVKAIAWSNHEKKERCFKVFSPPPASAQEKTNLAPKPQQSPYVAATGVK